MKISIIIPTFKRETILQQTIDAVLNAIKDVDAEIIVVNDGPDYPTLELTDDVLFLKNPNKGVSSARNFGYSQSSGEMIVFLDNDILITKETLIHFCTLLKKHPDHLFNPNWEYSEKMKESMQSNQFGRFLLTTGNYNYQAWAQDINWGSGPLINVDKLATFCLIMSRSVFKKIGGFDEQMHFGEEDLEMTIRAKKMGYELYVDESICVHHNEPDRVSLTNKLNRMKIVGAMLRSNTEFKYSKLKDFFLWIQSKVSFLLLSIAHAIPNIRLFDRLYFLFIHRLLANAIYIGYKNGNDNASIRRTYSKLK